VQVSAREWSTTASVLNRCTEPIQCGFESHSGHRIYAVQPHPPEVRVTYVSQRVDLTAVPTLGYVPLNDVRALARVPCGAEPVSASPRSVPRK
jgi:hypothetical protein